MADGVEVSGSSAVVGEWLDCNTARGHINLRWSTSGSPELADFNQSLNLDYPCGITFGPGDWPINGIDADGIVNASFLDDTAAGSLSPLSYGGQLTITAIEGDVLRGTLSLSLRLRQSDGTPGDPFVIGGRLEIAKGYRGGAPRRADASE